MKRNKEPLGPAAKRAKESNKIAPKLWKREEVLVLLDVYESALLQLINRTIETEDDLWITVSENLYDQGIDASAVRCQSKWNLLQKTYLANPGIKGAFFVKVKQILDTAASVEERTVESLEEEMKEEIRAEEAENTCKVERLEDEIVAEEIVMEFPHTEEHTTNSLTTERVAELLAGESEAGLRPLIERLCGKIDTLTEMQHRQEARLREVYQMQRTNEDHLLKIKKHLNIA
ncbi:uncharacterized protein LOC120904123 [Anopheles arabiensis]|uniref:Myb_DNA-bind_4 domain-containing protein n=3 Tax=gambiae species complex TaxID=44542 RepID=A0A1S4GYR6_ANOGA|nr:uncharacterized protein LOC120904123 [Anopheles arabiensis]